jgi:hypothetical protein
LAYIPDERFKGTLYDVEDCIDAITDGEVEKPSEKKKAVKMFELLLDFCMEEKLISSYTLNPLKFRLGLEIVDSPAGPQVVVETTAKELVDGK